MSDPNRHDDTRDDHERFEAALLAQDRDLCSSSTVDLTDETAQQLVRDLLDARTVTPVVDQRVLEHDRVTSEAQSMTSEYGLNPRFK